jgi:hypothetical protein
MLSRFIFAIAAVFWVVMNVLLWRSEFGGKGEMGGAVDLDKVWHKIITAPDNSSLEIYHHGKSIGYSRWSASVGEEPGLTKQVGEDAELEGMVKQPTSYMLDLDGNVMLDTNNLRFNLALRLSTNHVWETFEARATMRPYSWVIRARAATQAVELTVDDDSGSWQQEYTFETLRNPQRLVNELGMGWIWPMIAGLAMKQPATNAPAQFSLGLNWEARNDWMRFGHSKVRVYRVEAKLFDRFKVFLFVSRVGEILWVELPDKIVLSNDAFAHF